MGWETQTRTLTTSLGAHLPFCVQVSQCVPLEPGTEWSNAAGALVNPLTAYSMVQLAKERGHKVRSWTRTPLTV